MNTYAPVIGFGVCCAVPLVCLIVGILIGRHGLPLSVRYNWRRDPLDTEE